MLSSFKLFRLSLAILCSMALFFPLEKVFGQTLESLQADLAKIQKVVAVQQAEIRRAKNAMFAIGSVQQSFLTLEQFQAQMGTGWVLCDGGAPV